MLVFSTFFASCEKDDFGSSNAAIELREVAEPIVFHSGSTNKSVTQTVLGNVRQNPYTVENIAKAKHEVYGTTIDEVETTHLYVQFSPKSFEDIITLEESDLVLFDFPLDREVIQIGDYYTEPVEGEFPTYWTAVEVNQVLPAVTNVVLAKLNLIEKDPFIMHKAFDLTGNSEEAMVRYPLGFMSETDAITADELKDLKTDCHPGCASWPCCLTGELECMDDYVPNWCRDFNPDCYPGHENYPRCAEDGGGNGGGFSLNACGCRIPSNRREPAGCIQVEDTQLGLQGVKRVEVIAWNGWFNIDEVETNDNGCWHVDRSYKGNAYFWVNFKSNRARFRGVNNTWTAAWQWLTTIKDYVGQVSGPNFNNIQVTYDFPDVPQTQTHRFWGAATVNNALHEFHEYAIADGIATPRNRLDIFVGPEQTYGYVLIDVQYDLSVVAGLATSFIAQPFAPIVFVGTALYLPDVYVGTNYLNSDGLKSLAYHEFAHASHYNSVGRNYWRKLVLAAILAGNGGHGDQNSQQAELIAVCESWADYLGGHVYVDRTYGAITSIGEPWIELLERTWNERENHIPVGLFHDLVDTGEPIIGVVDGNNVTARNQKLPISFAFINDNVSGFTNAQLFSCLTPFTFTLGIYEDCLIDNHLGSTPSTEAQLTALFDSYFTN